MTAQDNRIQELYKLGKHYREIGDDVGLSIASVYRHLRKAGLLGKQKSFVKNARKAECENGKIMGFPYRLPHLFDEELDALTPKQIAERHQAELRGFEIDHRRRMTYGEAMRIFHLSYRELEQEFNVSTEQAKILVEVAAKTIKAREHL